MEEFDIIAERFVGRFNRQQQLLPAEALVSRAIVDNGFLTGFFNVDMRQYECGRFNTLHYPLTKYQAMIMLGRVTHLPVILVVKFDDLIAWLDITTVGGVKIKDAKKLDRKEDEDEPTGEKMVHLPIDIFQFIVE